jgi:transketolase
MTKATFDRPTGSWTLLDLLDQAPGLLAISDTLTELADEGHPVVALTGDLTYSNGLVRFGERHPERLFNMGISEQNMVTAGAGMAAAGLMPFVADFASFLALLCCEQIRTDIAYSKLPVRLIGHHSGITFGFYGTSHHATEDLAITRSIAGLTVVAPADPLQLSVALRASLDWPEPIYFRIGRGRDPDVYSGDDLQNFEFGRAITHGQGGDVTVITTGSMVAPTLQATKALKAEGIDAAVVDMHTIKPLDRDAVLDAAGRSNLLMTVEEHNVLGGLGGAVAEVLADAGAGVRLVRHGINDVYSLIGSPRSLYTHYRLDADGIAEVLREAVSGDHK